MKKLLIGLILVMLLVPVSCAKPPAPAPSPQPFPAPPSRLDVLAVSDKNAYLPGEPITIEFSLKNVTSAPLVISPNPPEIEIVLPTLLTMEAEVFKSFAPVAGQVKLEPGEEVTYTLVWDQTDSSGHQAAPGYYNLNVKAKNIRIDDRTARGLGTGAMVLIRCPQGAMEKTIEVNQSQTVNGLTITLERVELTSTAAKFYAFTIPPDYHPPEGQDANIPPHRLPYLSDMPEVHATYTVDGITKDALWADLGTRGDGITLAWANPFAPIDPVPSDAKDLTFIITQFGDWEGPWEFKIPLD